MTASSERIDEALSSLRRVVSEVVRSEQLRDQLTGLGNDHALTEWIQARMTERDAFWIAFFEVDRFKEINDEFGYANADTLLQRIAEQLKIAASFFPNGVVPFRAHGDEFFLAGPLERAADAEIAGTLEHVKTSIGQMKVRVRDKPRPMVCTMSVGWTTSRDQAQGGERGLRHNLELATSEAKHLGRNRVVRYTDHLRKAEVVNLRRNCARCACSFSATIPRSALASDGRLHCPNCGDTMERPPVAPPAMPQSEPEI